jgi:hypothetical protein
MKTNQKLPELYSSNKMFAANDLSIDMDNIQPLLT